jgi:hypothetical protein
MTEEEGLCECLPRWLRLGCERALNRLCSYCGMSLRGEIVTASNVFCIPCSDSANPRTVHAIQNRFHVSCVYSCRDVFMETERSHVCISVLVPGEEKSDEFQNFVLERCKFSARHVYCSGCGAREQTRRAFKRCGGCHIAYYCSETCQNDHWEKHKPNC